MRNHSFIWLAIFVLLIAFLVPSTVFSQVREKRPPELQEFIQAMAVEDLNARIKELERIKTAYPKSRLKSRIESAITEARINLCTSIGAIIELQKAQLASARGLMKVLGYYYAGQAILEHPNLKMLDKAGVTRAILQYKEEGTKLARDPVYKDSIQEKQRKYIDLFAAYLYLAEARAYLNESKPEKALEALAGYQASGGLQEEEFHYFLAEAHAALGQKRDAFQHYFAAAARDYRDSFPKAKALVTHAGWNPAEFDAKLEEKQKELPFKPKTFKAGKNWRGKTVLAELFTGSECAPCTAADLGFDGLIEAYEDKYVAVLEYHLPIPRPDPMMNHVSRRRGRFYGVRSTPTTFFDGEQKHGGGGSRLMAGEKFEQYSKEIQAKINEIPEVQLGVEALLVENDVVVDYIANKVIPAAFYNVALVQEEIKYQGSNGIIFHKMVVKELMHVDSATVEAGRLKISLQEAQKAAETRIKEFEKESEYKFQKTVTSIARNKLKVVFFVQDKQSKKVYNAVVCDVK